MKVALVDNGSLRAASHLGLRSVAASLSKVTGLRVEAVSWKHSDRIAPSHLDGQPGRVLDTWIRDGIARGERDFVVVPFFVSPGGAIGAALRGDLEALRSETPGFDYAVTAGLDDASVLAKVVAERVRETADRERLGAVPVAVVDHGGPAAESAAVRDAVASGVRDRLDGRSRPVVASSMESPEGRGYDFNRPLLSDVLSSPAFAGRDVIVAPLFLLPGRHAGSGGDLSRIAAEAERRAPGLRCHFTGLVGSHPSVAAHLAAGLSATLPVEAQS